MSISETVKRFSGKAIAPRRRELLLLGLLTLGLAATLAFIAPAPIDWSTAYRPAAIELLHGRTPYSVELYFNAPWTLLPLLPLALLPENFGGALLTVVGFIAYALIAVRLGSAPKTLVVLLLSPPVLHSLLNGSLDWLALSGVVMPSPIGLFFVSIKPQIGVAVAVFWLIEAWRDGGVREVVRVFGPFVAVLGITVLIFGAWPLRFEDRLDVWWNASLWPLSIPVGILLLAAAVRNRRIKYSMAASPFLSPFVLLHSWVGALFALSRSFIYSLVAVVGLWILVVLAALRG